MSPAIKLLAGIAATGIVTWASLMLFGGARAIADDLESRTANALESEGATGINVRVPRSPVSRTIHLAGNVPDDLKLRMRQIALDQSGVSGAVWESETEADSETVLAEAANRCQAELEALMAEQQITFRSGSPYINPESARLLDRIAETARGCEALQIEIAGHSDASGNDNVNREMSAYRATAVRDALVERGLPQAMLTTIGKGSDEPLDGVSPGDPANRRIEFTVRPASGSEPS